MEHYVVALRVLVIMCVFLELVFQLEERPCVWTLVAAHPRAQTSHAFLAIAQVLIIAAIPQLEAKSQVALPVPTSCY